MTKASQKRTMTKEELRQKIADKFIDWIASGELSKTLDKEALPIDTIGVTIDVSGIDRSHPGLQDQEKMKNDELVVAFRTRVDGRHGGNQLGHAAMDPEIWTWVEVSATP